MASTSPRPSLRLGGGESSASIRRAIATLERFAAESHRPDARQLFAALVWAAEAAAWPWGGRELASWLMRHACWPRRAAARAGRAFDDERGILSAALHALPPVHPLAKQVRDGVD